MSTSTVFADTIQHIEEARESYINDFRIKGRLDQEKKEALERRLASFVQGAEGKTAGQALFELATFQRLNREFETAIVTYETAATVAKENRDADTEFRAWIGIARAHVYGTRNHGAAAAAFERAVAVAGSEPTQKQRYDMADYSSQLQVGRGELEAALLNGLQAIRLAPSEPDRYYALIDTGDAMQKFAESCDYRTLIDARTNSEDDRWGACKRSVAAAKALYLQARSAAKELGWAFLENQAADFASQLDNRLFLINSRARSAETFAHAAVFNAQDLSQVLVNEDFASGGSALSGEPLASAIAAVVADAAANDPRSIYLRGIQADLQGKPAEALEHYQKAVQLLAVERASYFDIRQRGTVLETRPDLVRDLGLRLLALGKPDDAFLAFESIRSRGLEFLTAAFSQNSFTDAERESIAEVVQLDSQISAKENTLVEAAIAGIEHTRSSQLLGELDLLQKKLRERQGAQAFQSVRQRLQSTESRIPTLLQLRQVVQKAGIPVVLYWVTATNVVVWVVTPDETVIRTVFLPEQALIDKVNKLRVSVGAATARFDDKAARELHTYLLKPFAPLFKHRQVIVVPQGPLTGLPFEALVDAEDGTFAAEKHAISYAPSAASAIRALAGKRSDLSSVRVIFDEEIEKETHEISRIRSLQGFTVEAVSSRGKTPEDVVRLLGKERHLHVLLHGEYNYDDALLSTVKTGAGKKPQGAHLTAAELLAADWRETSLAVFSSCESALLKMRISNEGYGLSWGLLAGGVKNVLLSRWRVNAASNADWMETFYHALSAEKKSPALAANAAMVKMIAGKRSPYYWAGPQLFGR